MAKYVSVLIQVLLGVIVGIVNFALFFTLVNKNHDLIISLTNSKSMDIYLNVFYIIVCIGFFCLMFFKSNYKIFSVIYFVSAVLSLITTHIIFSRIGPG